MQIYVAVAQHGRCHVCHRIDDLRFGVCFDCSDHVAGEQITPTLHRLWDKRNPENVWYVQTGVPQRCIAAR